MNHWDLGVWVAQDERDQRNRERFGEGSVKAALLMYHVRLDDDHLFCDLLTLDRPIPEQEMTVTLHRANGAQREVNIHWDFDATGRFYRNGKFPLL